jgi:hypothetical protein
MGKLVGLEKKYPGLGTLESSARRTNLPLLFYQSVAAWREIGPGNDPDTQEMVNL